MYQIECAYQPTAFGPIFLPEDDAGSYRCALRVAFAVRAYYPAERDTGAGDDFDAGIESIEMLDARDSEREDAGSWRFLEGQARQNAEEFLDASCRDEMWAQAGEEAAEQAAELRYEHRRRAA